MKKSEWKKLLDSLTAPIRVIGLHKHDFFLWFVYVMFAGLLGVIINVVKRWIFDGDGFHKALTFDSHAGSFYTFSLVICSSLIWPIFKSLTSKEQPEYCLIRTVLLTLLIFTDLFSAIFYAFSSINSHKWFWQICGEWYPLDIPQLFFFILAIVLSIYSFGITYLSRHVDKFPVTDEHLRSENENVEKLKNNMSFPSGMSSETSKSQNKLPFNL